MGDSGEVGRGLRSLEGCTWQELARYADEIASVPGEDEALALARNLGLCDGSLDGTQTKRVTLADGTECVAQVAGFRHDQRADGAGFAGITWVLRDAVALHGYDGGSDGMASRRGGWEGSSLRRYLNEELLMLLPQDLRSHIKPVTKVTNKPGASLAFPPVCWESDAQPTDGPIDTLSFSTSWGTVDISGVMSRTTEKLWVLSQSEVFGWVGTYDSNYGEWDGFDLVGNAQGGQYQLFRDGGVSAYGRRSRREKVRLLDAWTRYLQGKPGRSGELERTRIQIAEAGDDFGCDILKRRWDDEPYEWWLRSPDPYSSFDRIYVDEFGLVRQEEDGTSRKGVIAGFCI